MPEFDLAAPYEGALDRRGVLMERCFVALLFLGAFVLRLWGASRMHFWDENVYLLNAETICCGKHTYNELSSRPPLLPLMFAGVFLFWHNDFSPYVVTSLLNAAGPVLLYLAGREFVGRVAAAIAALLLAFVPFYVSVFPNGFDSDDTGHSLLTDCPALTLILLGLLLLVRALKKERAIEFGLAGVAFGLSFLMRFPSLSTVGILSLPTLASKRRLRAVVCFAMGFGAAVTPYLVWSRIRYGGFLATLKDAWVNYAGSREPLLYLKSAPVLISWVGVVGLALWAGKRIWEGARATAALRPQLADILSGQRWGRQFPREMFLVLWAVVLIVYFSLMRHQEPRYIIPAAPPLFLLAGAGLSLLLRARRRELRIAGGAALAVALLWTFWPDKERFDTGLIDRDESGEMQTSDYLNHHMPPGTVLYTNVDYPDFAYYTNFETRVLPTGIAQTYQLLSTLPPNSVVIAFTYPGSEPSTTWLDANPHYTRMQVIGAAALYQSR